MSYITNYHDIKKDDIINLAPSFVKYYHDNCHQILFRYGRIRDGRQKSKGIIRNKKL